MGIFIFQPARFLVFVAVNKILPHQSMYDQKPNILLSISTEPWRFLLLGIIAHCNFFFLMEAWSSSCAYSSSFHFHTGLTFWKFFTLLINSDTGCTWWTFSTEDADDGGDHKSKRQAGRVWYYLCPMIIAPTPSTWSIAGATTQWTSDPIHPPPRKFADSVIGKRFLR